ncbi:hypothetical protein NLU13_5224 [Sarocladium strictum]|uniref:BTB domain-containing protein n=1 Tax=Sarocladium strictum TaxID=5046 RepID=A0AA39L706_SARSR|nr:hypothetical protein NLU13_5224 [Sarocladium strictum]
MAPHDEGAESACKKRRLSFTEIGLSAGFKVFIGPDKKEHLIHSAVLAKQSPVLDALVNSGMKETGENAVVWEHVSEHTFAKFSQFAYTGSISIKRSTEVYEYTEHSTGDGNSVTCGQWLIQHADLMVFAECYAVDELLTITSSTLDDALNLLIPLMKTLQCVKALPLFSSIAPKTEPLLSCKKR